MEVVEVLTTGACAEF